MGARCASPTRRAALGGWLELSEFGSAASDPSRRARAERTCIITTVLYYCFVYYILYVCDNRRHQNGAHASSELAFIASSESAHDTCSEHQLHAKIGVLGPYFIDEIQDPEDSSKTLTGSRYRTLLKDSIIPTLKIKLGGDFDTCWFQQDGASSHTAFATLEYLTSVFGSRLISNKTDHIWPPYSSDLTVLDYYFWNYYKIAVKNFAPKTVVELKEFAIQVAEHTEISIIRKAIGDFPKRLVCLLHNQGRHSEMKFKKFKSRIRPTTVCAHCNLIHYCDCKNCLDLCSEITAVNVLK